MKGRYLRVQQHVVFSDKLFNRSAVGDHFLDECAEDLDVGKLFREGSVKVLLENLLKRTAFVLNQINKFLEFLAAVNATTKIVN